MAGPIELEGLDSVLKALQRSGEEVKREASKGLQKAGLRIIADATRNLRVNGSWVTGLLAQSGKVQKVDEDNIDVGFFDTQNKQSGYAYFVEYGRKAGRMPPPDEIAQWAYKKLGLHDRKAAQQIGWALALKIAREGTTAHPFFVPAVEKNKKEIVQTIQDAINKTTR